MLTDRLRPIIANLMAILFVLIVSFVSEARPLSTSYPLDPTFDGDGKLLSALHGENISGNAILVQTDQKLVVAGSVYVDGDWDFVLLRYCPNGSLDDGVNCGTPGFGNGGRVIADFGGAFHDMAMDAALQSDGRIVVVGTSSLYPQFDMAVARFDTNGLLDPTFGVGGLVKIDFQNSSDERGYAVALQHLDGKIIVGGVSYINTWGDFALARLCPNGKLDDGVNCGSPAFGVGGKVITDFSGSSDWVSSVAVHDGKIIAGGSGGNKDFAVARYDANGNLDTSFGSNGKTTVSFGSGWDYGQDMLVQPDGKIVLAGGAYASDWNHDFGLVRFNTNGTLDTSFGTNGKVSTEFFGNSDRILSVTLQGEKLLAVGYAMHCYGNDLAVIRYNANGSLDTTFGVNGKVTTDFGGNYDAANAVAVQADGKVVVAGHTGDNPGGGKIALARYLTNGSLDPAFDGDGKVTSGIGHHLGIGVQAVGGKILVAGWANNGRNNDFALARFQNDGSLDTGFAVNGVATVDVNAGDDQAVAMAVQADGKVVLAGYTLQGSNSDFAVARYCSDGKPDDGVNCGSPGFGTGGKAVTDFGGSDFGRAVLIQPDGKIVVVGDTRSCPRSDFAVARYNTDGSPDLSFGSAGKVVLDFSANWNEARGAACQADNKLVVVGARTLTNNHDSADFALARLCADGSLDNGVHCGSPAFGVGGKVTTDFFGKRDIATAVAVQVDGKIVVAGESYNSSNDFALARYCLDGQMDDGVNCGSPAFGTGGKTTTDFFANWSSLASLLLLPNEKILVGGTASRDLSSGWDEEFALALYNQDGSLESSFGTGGKETVDFGSTDEQGNALALQSDGKILISGNSAGHLAMARYIYNNIFNLYLPILIRQ